MNDPGNFRLNCHCFFRRASETRRSLGNVGDWAQGVRSACPGPGQGKFITILDSEDGFIGSLRDPCTTTALSPAPNTQITFPEMLLAHYYSLSLCWKNCNNNTVLEVTSPVFFLSCHCSCTRGLSLDKFANLQENFPSKTFFPLPDSQLSAFCRIPHTAKAGLSQDGKLLSPGRGRLTLTLPPRRSSPLTLGNSGHQREG